MKNITPTMITQRKRRAGIYKKIAFEGLANDIDIIRKALKQSDSTMLQELVRLCKNSLKSKKRQKTLIDKKILINESNKKTQL